ncbi:hypothetical protein Vid5_gp59 [Pantoea phage vB_PagS_Vid5]|uniref:Uncharacterized protein n=1 Tax=Pantoea phage vB_PagS_Vid5 TaxID=2099652 RepID=A0A2P1CKW5_9CAUD|nr:hypothetical protein FDJ45_gp096 [Pantoea phage vB_PagS_Vid5]AVJ51814.1 hypothetical protein Vid5_gp59 [Pantoea phage vB_PagS_Vid5]
MQLHGIIFSRTLHALLTGGSMGYILSLISSGLFAFAYFYIVWWL